MPNKLTLGLTLAAMTALAACGDPEPEQRKAFLSFLQTRIIDKPGIHVPILTPDERKAFGPYAEHYAVISNFHKVMNESVSPKFSSAVSKASIHSAADLAARRDDFKIAKTTIGEMNAALGGDLTQADAEHGKLSQPADLKPVYDKAYDRLVTSVAATFREIAPIADRVFADALDLGDYIDQHKTGLKITGPVVQATDAATQKAFNAKLQALQSSQQAVNAAQAKFRELIYGAGR
ncbi:DUF3053 family protein [Methylobacterium brachythecii]|uniref:Lipoprotein n=1 Tax=Methylobacterium brachythecii TaxID=1176177 RepID=A0A7W6AF05_9HYPH|nr:DUF3053 family protein [Methylobacterium brachythecii]MBB3902095.1 hypothetical protein [Methylobacterium brachythecii]GLS44492.1 lipoprotein [Methylobacterium brachythecii]